MQNNAVLEITMCSSLQELYLYYLDTQIENRLLYTITNCSNQEVELEAGTVFQFKANFGDSEECLTQEANKSKISFHFQGNKVATCRSKEDYIEAALPQDLVLFPSQSYQIQIWGIYSLIVDMPTTVMLATLYQGRIYKNKTVLARKRKNYVLDQFQVGKPPMYRGSIGVRWNSIGASRVYLNTYNVTGQNFATLTLRNKTTVTLTSYDECDNPLQKRCVVEPSMMEIEKLEIALPSLEEKSLLCSWKVKNSPMLYLDYAKVPLAGTKRLPRKLHPKDDGFMFVLTAVGYPRDFSVFIQRLWEYYIVDSKFTFTDTTFSWVIQKSWWNIKVYINQQVQPLEGTIVLDTSNHYQITFIVTDGKQQTNGLVFTVSRMPVS